MNRWYLYFYCYFLVTSCQATLYISPQEARIIGEKIWQNECNKTIKGLTSWNDGEEFLSLGIGHFIWYPAKSNNKIFQETFPSLLTFFVENNVTLPTWLKQAQKTGCPWPNRPAFLAELKSKRVKELQTLLLNTVNLQIKFIINNLAKAIATIQTKVNEAEYAHLKQQFLRLAHSPNGLYVLIDYTNFKGTGLSTEKYNQKGWGLVHVLQKMHGNKVGKEAVEEFKHTAELVLKERIKNAPPERNEGRWLAGWLNRLKTYTALR